MHSQSQSECLLTGYLTVPMAGTCVGQQTHRGVPACVSWQAYRHTLVDGHTLMVGGPRNAPRRPLPEGPRQVACWGYAMLSLLGLWQGG